MSQYSPWFPPEVKPVRKGWYQRQYGNGTYFCHWDGVAFSVGITAPVIQGPLLHRSWIQFKPWRGLSKPTGGK